MTSTELPPEVEQVPNYSKHKHAVYMTITSTVHDTRVMGPIKSIYILLVPCIARKLQ